MKIVIPNEDFFKIRVGSCNNTNWGGAPYERFERAAVDATFEYSDAIGTHDAFFKSADFVPTSSVSTAVVPSHRAAKRMA